VNKKVVWIVLGAAFYLALVPLLPGEATMAALPPVQEISYYPRNHAWLEFWANWPDALQEMDADLDPIRDLGANTVRIFVHPGAFNYPGVPTPAQLERFEEALGLIDAHELRAHVNLFDCWWSWPEIVDSRAWMAKMVGPYRDDPRIALWELQNEVPLYDEKGQKNQAVHDWVRALFPDLKQLAGSTPCTVSVSHVEWLQDIKTLTGSTPPDLYSLHWYPDSLLTWTATLTATLQRAQELVGGDRLLLGEFGAETSTFTEDTQADLYRDVLYYAHQQGIVHLGQWTLYDFPEGTAQCDPATPASCAERHFGIYRLDGSPKPAAQVLRDAFHGRFPSSPGPALVHNPSFEEWDSCAGRLRNWFPWDERWTEEYWFEQDCTEAHTGVCSVRVGGVPTMTVGLYNGPALSLDLAPGKRYSLEGYARAHRLDGEAWIAFSWFDASGAWLNRDSRSNPISGTIAEWTRLYIDGVEPPPGAAYVQVFAQVGPASSGARVWFDGVTTLAHKAHLPLLQR
jgi:hypothetical protein